MFCEKCGCKVLEMDKRCSHCGAENKISDRCGGFFDLINQEVKDRPVASAVRAVPEADPMLYYKLQKEEEEENMRKKALLALSVICLILLIVVIGQAFKLNKISEQQNDVKKAVSHVEELLGGEKDRDSNGLCDLCASCLHDDPTVFEYDGAGEDERHHIEKCINCGETREVECEFDEDGKCTNDDCDNECPHEKVEVVSEAGDEHHNVVCEECGKEMKQECDFPENGGKCKVQGCKNNNKK